MFSKKIFASFGSLNTLQVSPGEAGLGWAGLPGIPSSIHHQGRARAGLTQLYLQGERAPHEPCPGHLDPSEASASSECPTLAVAAPGALDSCPTPNPSSYFSQFISGWSSLGSDCIRHLVCNPPPHGMGFPFQGIHILILTLQEAPVNSLSVFVVREGVISEKISRITCFPEISRVLKSPPII